VKHTARSLALGIALAVNAAALALVDTAMIEGAEKDHLAMHESRDPVTRTSLVAGGPQQPASPAADCTPRRL